MVQRYHASMFLVLIHLLSISCQLETPTPHRQFIAALNEVTQSPEKAITICAKIKESVHKNECMMIAVDKLLPKKLEDTAILCAAMSEKSSWECYFRLAEISRNIGDCKKSGPFDLDCKLHLLSGALSRGMPGTQKALELFEIPIENAAGWTAIYRNKLQSHRLLNRIECQKALHSKWCMRAGIGLFQERINRAKEVGEIPCIGRPLPDHLQPGTDEELIALITEERKPCR